MLPSGLRERHIVTTNLGDMNTWTRELLTGSDTIVTNLRALNERNMSKAIPDEFMAAINEDLEHRKHAGLNGVVGRTTSSSTPTPPSTSAARTGSRTASWPSYRKRRPAGHACSSRVHSRTISSPSPSMSRGRTSFPRRCCRVPGFWTTCRLPPVDKKLKSEHKSAGGDALIGKLVAKEFMTGVPRAMRWSVGTITSFDPVKGYSITYVDGATEDVSPEVANKLVSNAGY